MINDFSMVSIIGRPFTILVPAHLFLHVQVFKFEFKITEIPLYIDEEYTEEFLEERFEFVPESEFATSNDQQRLKREDSDHLESVFELMELMIEKSHGLFDSQMDLLNKVVD